MIFPDRGNPELEITLLSSQMSEEHTFFLGLSFFFLVAVSVSV